MSCWVCSGRGDGQVPFRPAGRSDGKRLCRPCVRRMVGWVAEAFEKGRPEELARVWPGAAARFSGDPEPDAIRALVSGVVFPPLSRMDDPTRLLVAISYLELGLQHEALRAVATVRPEALEAAGIPERTLSSLFSRLLDGRDLAAGARETLADVFR